jgi:hypothetical protein
MSAASSSRCSAARPRDRSRRARNRLRKSIASGSSAHPSPTCPDRALPSVKHGTEAYTCTLTVQGVAGASAVQSQIESYRAKAKEFARLTVVAKSLRHSRQYRKLAEMYWALALGEELERAKPSKMHVKRTT